MATYSGFGAAKTVTLGAGVSDTFQFASTGSEVVLTNLSANNIFYRIDGITPTVEGDGCYVLAPGVALSRKIDNVENFQVKCIAALASKVTVAVII